MKEITTKLSVMTESEKIMYITENILGATSQSSAVTMEQIIEKGIELGVTKDYPRGKEDGHPWFPRTSVMMGIGDNVGEREEFHLHRKKMEKVNGGSCMHYWVDWSQKHEIVRRNTPVSNRPALEEARKEREKKLFSERHLEPSTIPCPCTPDELAMMTEKEKFDKYNSTYPGEFFFINGKIISFIWATQNPLKFKKLYGEWVNENPSEWERVLNKEHIA